MGPLGQPELLLQKHTQPWNWCGGYHPAVIYFPRNDIAMAFLIILIKRLIAYTKGMLDIFQLSLKTNQLKT